MKKTLIAIGAFAVLLALVLATREKQVNVGVPRLALPALGGEVTGVEISGAHSAKLVFEGAEWKVSGHRADDGLVKALAEALKDFRAQDFVTDKPEKHAELEVDDAKGTKVVVSTASGPVWALVFGKASQGGGTFVRDAKSNAVFITKSSVALSVKKELNAWRRRSIATANVADLVKVKVTQPPETLSLVKVDDKWESDPKPPKGFRFDSQAAQRLVQQLGFLSAQDFLDSNPGELPNSVEAELKDGKKLVLHLGAARPDGNVPLRLEGDAQIYLVSKGTAEALLKKLDDLRDTALLAFEPDKVTRVALSAGGKATVLSKDGATWKLLEPRPAPAGFELDAQAVGRQLQQWKSLRAARVVTGVSDAAAGLGKPVAKLELTLEGGAKQAVLLGGETPAKDLYVRGSVDSLLYAIGSPQKRQLEQGPELFKKRPPPDFSHAQGLDQLPPEVRRQLEAQLRNQAAHP